MKLHKKIIVAAAIITTVGSGLSASATTYTATFLGGQVNSRIFGSTTQPLWQPAGTSPFVTQLNMQFNLNSNDTFALNTVTGGYTFASSGTAAENTLLEAGAPGLFSYIVAFGDKDWMSSAVGTMNNSSGGITAGLGNLLNTGLAIGTTFADQTTNHATDGAWVKLINAPGQADAGQPYVGLNVGQGPGQIDYEQIANGQGHYLTLTLINKSVVNGNQVFDYALGGWAFLYHPGTTVPLSQFDFVNATIRFTGNPVGGNPVPEPATMALLISGAIPLVRRRMKKS